LMMEGGMKSLRIGVLALAAMMVASCGVASTAPPGGLPAPVASVATSTVQVVAGKVTLEGKRGLIFASNAYQAAAAIVVPLIRNRKLTPAQVDQVERLNEQAAAFLSGADRTLSLAQRSAGIFSIADRLYRLAGK
jgi:hypothetical protein